MSKFAKTCFCQKSKIEFRADKNFDEQVVDILYCPACVDRAANDALIINVTDIPLMFGLWGIKWSSAFLKEADKNFRDADDYYVGLFTDGRCTFEEVWKKRKKSTYEIVGIKSGIAKLKQEEALSGPDYLTIRKDGKPVRLPKKTWTRGEESGPRQSGYKGHK